MERNLTETPKRFSLSSFARRWWLIPIAVAATALAGFGAAQLKENNYASSSWIVASSDDGSPGPGRGFDASRLALTYATSLAEDDQLINHIATAIGKSTDEVDDHFTVLNQPDTAALRLRYRDDDPAVAQAGSRAAAEGVVGSQPVASSVTPGTLSLVQVADDPKKGTNLTVLGLILGAALGLGLALILMFAWERADPRVDDPHDAQALTGIPTTRLDDLTPSRASALLERWLALSGKSAPRVTIVPTSKMESLGGLTAGWLYGLHTDGPAAHLRLERLVGRSAHSRDACRGAGAGPAGRRGDALAFTLAPPRGRAQPVSRSRPAHARRGGSRAADGGGGARTSCVPSTSRTRSTGASAARRANASRSRRPASPAPTPDPRSRPSAATCS